MMPQATPANSCSARCAILAAARGSQAMPAAALNVLAIASSNAADDERPAPDGTFAAVATFTPVSVIPAGCIAKPSAHGTLRVPQRSKIDLSRLTDVRGVHPQNVVAAARERRGDPFLD